MICHWADCSAGHFASNEALQEHVITHLEHKASSGVCLWRGCGATQTHLARHLRRIHVPVTRGPEAPCAAEGGADTARGPEAPRAAEGGADTAVAEPSFAERMKDPSFAERMKENLKPRCNTHGARKALQTIREQGTTVDQVHNFISSEKTIPSQFLKGFPEHVWSLAVQAHVRIYKLWYLQTIEKRTELRTDDSFNDAVEKSCAADADRSMLLYGFPLERDSYKSFLIYLRKPDYGCLSHETTQCYSADLSTWDYVYVRHGKGLTFKEENAKFVSDMWAELRATFGLAHPYKIKVVPSLYDFFYLLEKAGFATPSGIQLQVFLQLGCGQGLRISSLIGHDHMPEYPRLEKRGIRVGDVNFRVGPDGQLAVVEVHIHTVKCMRDPDLDIVRTLENPSIEVCSIRYNPAFVLFLWLGVRDLFVVKDLSVVWQKCLFETVSERREEFLFIGCDSAGYPRNKRVNKQRWREQLYDLFWECGFEVADGQTRVMRKFLATWWILSAMADNDGQWPSGAEIALCRVAMWDPTSSVVHRYISGCVELIGTLFDHIQRKTLTFEAIVNRYPSHLSRRIREIPTAEEIRKSEGFKQFQGCARGQ
eukprot:TRINITY_DN474_c0_g1_i12.p1 TRINITY_DN474_c0_g1~~TRINITY_DN474_c0_g1_i12.p1  ORF type:complete len:595 (+),score=48.86 TRINITY_DN474_c0_g1_i12:1570-3354(+)